MSGNPNPTKLDQNQILQRSFDESQDKLRVEASVTVDAVIGEVSVEIDAADGDNIALANADGSKKVTVTDVGSKNGLDVNVIGDKSGLSVPDIQNISVASANTEYSLVLPSSTRKITLQLRNVAVLKIAFVSGQSGTNYYTIPAGSTYEIPSLQLTSSLTMYYQASKVTTMEVLTWS